MKLGDYKQAEQLPLDLDLAIAEAIEGLAIVDPGPGHKRKPRLTKSDGASVAIVGDIHTQEWRPPKRW